MNAKSCILAQLNLDQKTVFPAKITRKRLYLKETAILNFKYIPPKNGRGAAAPLVDWNRRP